PPCAVGNVLGRQGADQLVLLVRPGSPRPTGPPGPVRLAHLPPRLVAGLLPRLRIGFFQAEHGLEPGERCEKALYRDIDERALFLLFWSRAAQQSEWVLKELRYALARKEDDDAAP